MKIEISKSWNLWNVLNGTVCVIKGSVEIFVNENLSSISCRNIKIWQKKNRIIEKKIRKGIMSGNFM